MAHAQQAFQGTEEQLDELRDGAMTSLTHRSWVPSVWGAVLTLTLAPSALAQSNANEDGAEPQSADTPESPVDPKADGTEAQPPVGIPNAPEELPTKSPAEASARLSQETKRFVLDESAYAAFVTARTATVVERRRKMCSRAITDKGEAKADDAAAQNRFVNRQASTAAVASGSQSSTAADRLGAAFSTSVSGVEAGVGFAPLGLLGPRDSSFAWTVQLAALEDQKSRVGTGASYQWLQVPDVSEIITDVGCSEDWANSMEVDVRAQLESAKTAFAELCAEVVPLTPAGERQALAKICAVERPSQNLLPLLVRTLEKVADEVNERPAPANLDLRVALLGNKNSIEALETTSTKLTDAGAGYDEAQFLTGYRQALYRLPIWALGLDGAVDFDAVNFGRQTETINDGEVEEESLPKGEVLAWRVGPTITRKQSATTLSLSAKIGQAIPLADNQRRNLLAVSAESNWVQFPFFRRFIRDFANLRDRTRMQMPKLRVFVTNLPTRGLIVRARTA